MRKSIFIVLLIIHHALIGQTINRVEVHGVISANSNDVEAVAIYNTSPNKGTITNEQGAFVLEVAEHDVIEISALQFESKTVIITKEVIEFKLLKVFLSEHVNLLEEVKIGHALSGDLLLDIKNNKGKPPINFYDVGIPGYTGKVATQSGRMLYAAGEFKPSMLLGIILGGVL